MNDAFMSTKHIVVLMLENRSFDHMLGYLYADQGNRSSSGQPFEGLSGEETNPDSGGNGVTVFRIAPTDQNAYFMPGADPGEGYVATNMQLFGTATISSAQEPVRRARAHRVDIAMDQGGHRISCTRHSSAARPHKHPEDGRGVMGHARPYRTRRSSLRSPRRIHTHRAAHR